MKTMTMMRTVMMTEDDGQDGDDGVRRLHNDLNYALSVVPLP